MSFQVDPSSVEYSTTPPSNNSDESQSVSKEWSKRRWVVAPVGTEMARSDESVSDDVPRGPATSSTWTERCPLCDDPVT